MQIREIFDRVQLPSQFVYSDTNRIHIRVQNVRAMPGRLHELRVNELGPWPLRHIFRKPTEVSARQLHACEEAWLPGKSVLRLAVFSHYRRVPTGGGSQRIVPMQRSQSLIPSRPVDLGKQFFLGLKCG